MGSDVEADGVRSGETTPEVLAREDEAWEDDVPELVRPALVGFYVGVLTVLLTPVLWVLVLRAVWGPGHAEHLVWWVFLVFLIPLGLITRPATRRPGTFMLLGMALTLAVVAVTVTVVLWVMVAT